MMMPTHEIMDFRNGVERWIAARDLSIFTVARQASLSISQLTSFLKYKTPLSQEDATALAKALGAGSVQDVMHSIPPKETSIPTVLVEEDPIDLADDVDIAALGIPELRNYIKNDPFFSRDPQCYRNIEAMVAKKDALFKDITHQANVSLSAASNYIHHGFSLAPATVIRLLDVLEKTPDKVISPYANYELCNSEQFRTSLNLLMQKNGISRTTLTKAIHADYSDMGKYLNNGKPLVRPKQEALLAYFDIKSEEDMQRRLEGSFTPPVAAETQVEKMTRQRSSSPDRSHSL